MSVNILQPNVEKRGVILDPRTKMLLLITVAVFIVGGAGGATIDRIAPAICMIPFVLFCMSKKIKKAFIYLTIYVLAYVCFQYFGPRTTGLANYILLAVCGILSRFYPSIMLGAYLIETTTVSEFIAAMSKMHITEKITIPLSVMFRFFPTVADEFKSINEAMKMRGIKAKNPAKFLEYRMVPLMVCLAKIGEELNAAALTRGLGGKEKRTNMCKIGFHIQDAAMFVVCFGIYATWIISGLIK